MMFLDVPYITNKTFKADVLIGVVELETVTSILLSNSPLHFTVSDTRKYTQEVTLNWKLNLSLLEWNSGFF